MISILPCLRDKIDMAVRLFDALKVEAQSLRFIIQEATSSLAVAYKVLHLTSSGACFVFFLQYAGFMMKLLSVACLVLPGHIQILQVVHCFLPDCCIMWVYLCTTFFLEKYIFVGVWFLHVLVMFI